MSTIASYSSSDQPHSLLFFTFHKSNYITVLQRLSLSKFNEKIFICFRFTDLKVKDIVNYKIKMYFLKSKLHFSLA
ncbi:hypothetical protein SK110_0357 [Lactococcus cremoris]|nr:hypothetical protein SK110_0357 [Lactococcus cremoris]